MHCVVGDINISSTVPSIMRNLHSNVVTPASRLHSSRTMDVASWTYTSHPLPPVLVMPPCALWSIVCM